MRADRLTRLEGLRTAQGKELPERLKAEIRPQLRV
jgi:hypothetical protein